ncbi:CW-type zinc finger protein [Medicago truncatula]|uniref:CW-type zinc finger protein n=1 Tax=Medicago truncatula TaxID=3880 RepID=G7K2L3_MEDTR|nr:CW-type zinc finger protein [Medicago truncatula]
MSMALSLKKDWKPICDIKFSSPPTELPQELNIDSIVKKKKLADISALPQFSVAPAPNSSRDRNEWGKFLNFLHRYDMVAITGFEQYKFYILPPPIVSISSTVNIAYQIGSICTRPRDCESGPSNGGDVSSSRPKFPPEEDLANHFTSETCGGSQSRVMQDRLHGKNSVKIDQSYLKTLGQAHSGWIFGGIAELVDNSSDAKATKMDIFVEMIKLKKSGKDVPMLSVIDDGQGMNHEEVIKMVSLGHKQSGYDDKDQIGRFGVGFKTGAMRLGRDVLVLTQTANSRSIAFLSQSLNEGKDNIEIPIVSYCRQGQQMEVDPSAQSESLAKFNLKAIQDNSPFNKYLIGEKAALFCGGTGTQIYIWNLDEWGSECCLEWHDGLKGGSSFHQGDIFIRSKRSRARLGQLNQKVPLDYSLRAYLEVIFLVPRMKISVQRKLVKSRPLANFLTNTIIATGDILGRAVELILGFSQLEWDQASCGVFLYWHGRLIEAYKRVGGMIHSADVGRGVIGVMDVTNLMDDQDGRVWVHNNKQGFQDCETYACLEQWLGKKADEYWDNNFDSLSLDNEDNCVYKPDCEWVQCDKCRKWRMLPPTFDNRELPMQWFCYMEPFKGKCADAEQKVKPGIVAVSTKRSGYDCMLKGSRSIKMEPDADVSGTDDKFVNSEDVQHPTLKRLKKGLPRHEDAKSPSLNKSKKR